MQGANASNRIAGRLLQGNANVHGKDPPSTSSVRSKGKDAFHSETIHQRNCEDRFRLPTARNIELADQPSAGNRALVCTRHSRLVLIGNALRFTFPLPILDHLPLEHNTIRIYMLYMC